ncbi:FHA domain-containing protein [Thalassoglobus sp.]|uniref:FHA domain-containing protein n=1 Tax=Thalassoglobus sp. TaxID=2795869 RepID=UPI003AA8A972
MADVTIQVVQGLEAGAILRKLPTPITIGREEENLVQLNDERISRYHAKIQANEDQLILTDLQSTNGTRVNGHFTRMRTVQVGDQIALGRCLLVIGSPEELEQLGDDLSIPDAHETVGDDPGDLPEAFPLDPPQAPTGLSANQIAEVATLIEFIRTEMLTILNQIQDTPDHPEGEVRLPDDAWHRLQMLPPQLSRYLDELIEPQQD